MIRQRLFSSHDYSLVLAVGLLFWTCGSALAISVITRTDITPFYSLSEVMVAKQDGGLATEVHGGPSRLSTAHSVLQPLKLPARVGGGRLTAVEPGAAVPYIRIVLLFNADYLSARAACRDPKSTGAHKADGSLNVFAVLCAGDEYFSQAHLHDAGVKGETDTGYAGSMMQLFLALMPSKDEVERDRDQSSRD